MRLWRMVDLARHRLLMLDYDGTLAPFVVRRAEAHLPRRSLELLTRIANSSHTTVAVVSGRPLREIVAFLGDLPVMIVGEHGWERRSAAGEVTREPVESSITRALDECEQAAREAGLGVLVERKRSAIVLHTRALPPSEARLLQEDWASKWGLLARGVNVSLDHMDGGVELRARGRNKGTAVTTLLSQAPPGSLSVFVGDDVTDEDAFAVLHDRGFGIKVGDLAESSLAEGRLSSTQAVGVFLEEWLRLLESHRDSLAEDSRAAGVDGSQDVH